MMRTTKLKGFGDLELYTYVYDDVKDPKAVVQIIHGMREHAGRYADFCKFLEKNGYIVIATDQRGHGHTAKSLGMLGHGEKDIYAECVQDQKLVSEHISYTYNNLPLYVFAHSFGSMVAQRYIEVCHLPQKVILCGTTNGSNPTFWLGRTISTVQSWFVSPKRPALLIEKSNKKLYASKFERGNWLSRNETNFDKYLADPFCNAPFPISFYKSLFKHMTTVNRHINCINQDIKIMLIAGSNDPVGEYAKRVKSLFKKYQKHGLDVSCKIYNGARHELINETNKDEVYEDVLDFYDEKD